MMDRQGRHTNHSLPMSGKIIHDVSVTLGGLCTYWPGDPAFQRDQVLRLADGGVADVSRLTLSAHAGTHVDSPAHFIAGARTLDQYPPSRFVLPATVVDVADDECVRPEHIASMPLAAGEALLLKTRNSARGLCRAGTFCEQYVYLSPDAARLCAQRRLGLVGIDYLSVDRYGDEGFPAHMELLSHDVLILETIDLAAVAPGRYTLSCLPLKLKDCEASPVRAVLIED